MNEAMLRPGNHLPVPSVILLKLSSFSRPRSHLGSTSELFPLLLILQVTVDTCSLTPSRLTADEVRACGLHPVLSVLCSPGGLPHELLLLYLPLPWDTASVTLPLLFCKLVKNPHPCLLHLCNNVDIYTVVQTQTQISGQYPTASAQW